jgi:hypothetical protein
MSHLNHEVAAIARALALHDGKDWSTMAGPAMAGYLLEAGRYLQAHDALIEARLHGRHQAPPAIVA